MRIKSDKVTLRNWQETDLQSLVRYADNFNVWINLRDAFPHPYTEEAGRNWLGMAMKEDENLLLAIDVEGEAVGGVGAHFLSDVYRINCEIGYWLAEPFWGRGLVSASVNLLVEYIFSHYPEILRIYADLFAYNTASARVLEKCGFALEAVHKKAVLKNGQLVDEHRYVMFRPA